MTLREMHIFIEVCKTGSMTEAGRRLFISQSTVSQVILALEKQYHLKLFERNKKRLIITEQGKIMQNSCIKILSEVEELEYSLSHMGQKHIRVGTTLISSSSVLNQIWSAYHLACPDVRTQIVVEDNESLVYKLQNHDLDVVITEQNVEARDMFCRKFAEDVFVLICAEGNEFFNRDRIQLNELHGKQLITRERGNPTRELIEQVMAEQNILIHLIEFNNIDIIKAEVIKKHGIAIMARRLLVQELQRRLLRAIPIADLKKKRSFYVLSQIHSLSNPIIEQFINICQSIA